VLQERLIYPSILPIEGITKSESYEEAIEDYATKRNGGKERHKMYHQAVSTNIKLFF